MENLLNQLVYFAFFQSIFLLGLFTLSPAQRVRINGYFIVLAAVLLIGLSGRILYLSEVFGRNARLITLSEFATLLFGSTIFLFSRAALLHRPFAYRDLWHYAPAVVYNLGMIVFFILPSDQALGERIASGAFYRFVTFFVGFGLLFNVTYWILSFRIFLQFRRQLTDEVSYAVRSRFFFIFLVAVGMCLAAWLGVYLQSILSGDFIARPTTQLIWLGLALLILFLAYYGIRQPELYQVPAPMPTGKYAGSRLSEEDLNRLKEKLDRLMLEQKPYLNRKLLKAELAELLGVSSPELARLLNENIGMNFFEYVNYFRIKEFVALARTERAQNLTLFGLAQEAGFNSKTTFNKAFRELMGSSPGAYLKSWRKVSE
ncbi:MAG: helix-turn-helix domain-containing protein [Bacteroidota bacterium]